MMGRDDGKGRKERGKKDGEDTRENEMGDGEVKMVIQL